MSALHERQKDCRIHSPLRNLRGEVRQKHLNVSIYSDVDRAACAECEKGSNCLSPNAKPHVANRFAAETRDPSSIIAQPRTLRGSNLSPSIISRRPAKISQEIRFSATPTGID
jgi:hypothetical protein